MNLYNHEVNPKKLPFDLKDCRDEIGLIGSAILKCPGVYYVQICQPPEHPIGQELYIVMEEAPISSEARAYGQKVPTHPELLFYSCDGEDFAYKIVEYEITKFYIKYDIPVEECENLHSRALFGMEVCPDYFGTYPIPAVTPWGYTTRSKALIPGVFWLETDQCKTALALSYALRDDISDETCNLAVLAPFEQERGIDETMGYYFFEEKIMCLAVFELMLFNPDNEWDAIDEVALMNAIWANFPEYAVEYNLREQRGMNDSFGLAMQHFAPSYPLYGSPENMIALTPDRGVDFFCFDKNNQ